MTLGILNAEKRPWYLPQIKSQCDHTIHLSDFALAQFRLLAQMREPLAEDPEGMLSPWVFPTSDTRAPV